MKRKSTKLATLFLAFILGLCACGSPAADPTAGAQPSGAPQEPTSSAFGQAGAPVEGGTFNYALSGDITTLNPLALIGNDDGQAVVFALYDILYYIDKDETRYFLVEGYEISDDGLTGTLHFRDGAKWHDGAVLDANDFMWNMEMVKNPDNAGVYDSTYAKLANAEYTLVDSLTVTVTLPAVDASFWAVLGKYPMIPKHIFENEADLLTSQKLMEGVGSGAYKLREWSRGQNLVLDRFEEYYRGSGHFDSVVFKVMADESAREVAFQNGELSFLRVTNDQKLDKYKTDAAYQVVSYSEGRVNYLNYSPNSEKLKDQRAREAITYALNIPEIVLGSYGASEELCLPGESFFSPTTLYNTGDVKRVEQDLDKAKQLADESGLTGQTLTYIYNSNRPNMKETATVIQQQLKAINVNLEIIPLETAAFFARFFLYEGNEPYDLGTNGYSFNGDPSLIDWFFMSGQAMSHIYLDDQVNGLWAQAIATNDDAQRTALYQQLQEHVRDSFGLIPISYPNYCIVADKKLRGLDDIELAPGFQDYLRLYYVVG